MASEIKLRPVPAAREKDGAHPAVRRGPGGAWPWPATTMVLGLALAVALGWQTWTRIELSERIVLLEEETRALHATVAARDRVIGAQEARFDEVRDQVGAVRDQVERLGALLAQPIR